MSERTDRDRRELERLRLFAGVPPREFIAQLLRFQQRRVTGLTGLVEPHEPLVEDLLHLVRIPRFQLLLFGFLGVFVFHVLLRLDGFVFLGGCLLLLLDLRGRL